jgi:hypothetical protein
VSERFFSLRLPVVDPLPLVEREAAFVAEAISRGIIPGRVIPLPVPMLGDLAEFDLVVIGTRDESQGWDADGAPTCEWPRPSFAWVEPVERAEGSSR